MSRSLFIVALFGLAISASSAFAIDIRAGATMHVKPNSIWFQDDVNLTHWQELMKAGDTKAAAAYADEICAQRDAWQFINQLTVKIVSYDSANNRVSVESQDPGRLQGTKWMLDPSVLVK
jgi:hypothetical protein